MTARAARVALLLAVSLALSACSKGCSSTSSSPPTEPERTQQRPVRLVAVGDILLGDAAQKYLDLRGYDFPFEHLHGAVAGHDLLVGNLEAPITDSELPVHEDKKYVYRQRKQVAGALEAFGFDLLCLANNHALDYGPSSLFDTTDALDEVGIGYFGAGRDYEEAIRPRVVDIEGVQIGFVGFYKHRKSYEETYDFYASGPFAGVAPMTEEAVREGMKKARVQSDVVVASFHWGSNYAGVKESQVEWAHRAVELGADLVLGHHPHVVQGVEIYEGVPILYSLGNFTFGTPGRFRKVDRALHHGWVADITIEDHSVRRVDLLPIRTNNKKVRFQPEPADPDTLREIIEVVNAPFGTELQVVDGRARIELNARSDEGEAAEEAAR